MPASISLWNSKTMQVYIRSPHLATLGLLFLACSPALANNGKVRNISITTMPIL